MANSNGWGDGAANNTIGWGKGATNAIGWGSVYAVSSAGRTDIIGGPALAAPENLSLPAIDGITTWMVGMTIGFTGNEWSGNPVPVLTYQWLRNGGNISGATDDTYDLIGDDESCVVGVKCTATNSQGTAFVVSNEVFIFA